MKYPWTSEKAFLAERFKDFAKRAEDEKRALPDPLNDQFMIKCSHANCRVRYKVDKAIWAGIKNPEERIVFDLLKAFLSRHEHAFTEIGLRVNANFYTFFCGTRHTAICSNCREICPLATEQVRWNHDCNQNIWWIPFENGLAPTLRFNPSGQVWILKVPFHNKIWDFLEELDPDKISRDTEHKVWLLHDTLADKVAQFCKNYFPNFIYNQQARQRAAMNPNNVSRRALAAMDLLTLMPQEVLKAFYRTACVSMHPDKCGGTREANERFGKFQEAWRKFQEAQ